MKTKIYIDKVEFFNSCPLCSGEVKHDEYMATHIYVCEACPFVGFEFCLQKDLEALTSYLNRK